MTVRTLTKAFLVAAATALSAPALHAEPVYRLLGLRGLGVKDMPAVDHPVGQTIGYHIRRGDHEITPYDWQQYLDFADRHFR